MTPLLHFSDSLQGQSDKLGFPPLPVSYNSITRQMAGTEALGVIESNILEEKQCPSIVFTERDTKLINHRPEDAVKELPWNLHAR